MLKLAYKVGSRGGAMVSTSVRNAGDPWFESRSWYDPFLYVNIHLFIYIFVYIICSFVYINACIVQLSNVYINACIVQLILMNIKREMSCIMFSHMQIQI